ncbi:MAG: RdgB/HAM1 family non-canonical purine NTP pyrophosphatase [Bdellovibrionaceae bacterium]|nr:RdgB/HAM1 family non-canonical purine NTP pyrophosphatase [Pseudobdellovibrionaceae bacterium]
MTPLKTLWIASFNPGKLTEFRRLFEQQSFDLRLAKDIAGYESPEETGDTFEANAKIKAYSLFKILRQEEWVLAEDSGIMVEGLGGLPGVHSARYAGPKASDLLNNDKLLKMLKLRSPLNRKAKYVSYIYIKSPDVEFSVFGELEGQIAHSAKGKEGFGYDPIFIPTGFDKTMAELGMGIKNQISHRQKACTALKTELERLLQA